MVNYNQILNNKTSFYIDKKSPMLMFFHLSFHHSEFPYLTFLTKDRAVKRKITKKQI